MNRDRARKIERFLSQPLTWPRCSPGADGKQVPLEETIQSFRRLSLVSMTLPEGAFYMVVGIRRR